MLEEKQLQEQDLSLAQRTFDMNELLKKEKVISDLEYRNEQSKLINKKLSIPHINAAIISNNSEQSNKQREIIELDNTIAQQKLIFREVLNTFRSEVEDWKKKYLLTAPITGTISFAGFIQTNQELKSNEVICYIRPDNSAFYAEMFIPQENFGKVKNGQVVLLDFKAYPEVEYGNVKGKIEFISMIPSDSGYLAKVSLPQGLKTNYSKVLQYRNGLEAEGEIITKDLNLLQRLYFNLFKKLDR